MDDDQVVSADDALEPNDNGIFGVDDQEILPEDNDTPTTPLDDTSKTLSSDDPRTDTDLDSDEVYDVGQSDATGFSSNDDLEDNRESGERLA